MLEAIGKELKLIRIRNDLKLKDVAHNLCINQETLRRYENCASGLTIEKLQRILDYYKFDKIIFFNNVGAYMHKELDK